jgi:hypothetical protein
LVVKKANNGNGEVTALGVFGKEQGLVNVMGRLQNL